MTAPLYRPPMNTDKHEFSDSLTEQVLAGVFEVSNTLGAGFLEKVYERALLRELGLRGLRTTAQAAFVVKYKGFAVGEYFADILVLVEDTLMGRTEMRGPLSQLSQGLRPHRMSASQSPEAQGRMEANSP